MARFAHAHYSVVRYLHIVQASDHYTLIVQVSDRATSTHRLRHSDHSVQPHNIGVVELPHDGCLLEESYLGILPQGGLECLHCHVLGTLLNVGPRCLGNTAELTHSQM